MNVIVAKFGGTSVKNAERMLASAAIVAKNPHVKVTVVSATSGTTDQLIRLWQEGNETLLQEIADKHWQIASDLALSRESSAGKILAKLLLELQQLLKERTHSKAERDLFLSFGERLSSVLFVEAVKKHKRAVALFDVREVMKTTDHFGDATPLIEEMHKRDHLMINAIQACDMIVTQGFLGSTLGSNETTTLGRGGSDYSAALLAALLDARELHIWTDVSGVATVDPKIIPHAKFIHELTYFEAAELANLGAKVLHPLTLSPCVDKEIPVFVGNSFAPEERGTWIRAEVNQDRRVKAFAKRGNQSIVTFSKIKKLQTHGFLAQIFGILAREQISVDHITTSEISTSIALQDCTRLTPSVLKELQAMAEVSIEGGLSLISLIGHHIVDIGDIEWQIFNTVKGHFIRSIYMGASKNNISFVVHEGDASEVIKKLHAHFIEEKEK